MKIYFDALGCPKALVDAERMCYFLEQGGHTLAALPEDADAVVVNTCGFIGKAKEENIGAILEYARIKKTRPGFRIVVSGCLTERYRKDLLRSIPEIDAAIGVRDPSRILQAVNAEQSGHLLDHGPYRDNAFSTERSLYFSGLHYAYLKLSEGCDRKCSFCSIPIIRGKQRSRAPSDILKEARFLSDSGVRELILISEDTLSYGRDLSEPRPSLTDLLSELERMDFDWIRPLYLYPDRRKILETAEFMAGRPKFCRYIDMPLQHASGKILKSMKRNGDAASCLELIRDIRSIDPEFRIRSAFITGYPGETAADHGILKEFLSSARLDRAGFFEFSREEGTRAYQLPGRVSDRTVHGRMRELQRIQNRVSRSRLSRLTDKILKCISDGVTETVDGTRYALYRTEYDAPEIDGTVYVPADAGEKPEPVFRTVRITGPRGSHNLNGLAVKAGKSS